MKGVSMIESYCLRDKKGLIRKVSRVEEFSSLSEALKAFNDLFASIKETNPNAKVKCRGRSQRQIEINTMGNFAKFYNIALVENDELSYPRKVRFLCQKNY